MASLSFLHEQVAKTLVLYREKAGLSVPAAAHLLAVTPDIVRSHETGTKQFPVPGMVADWLRDYGAPQYVIDETKEFCRVIRNGDPSRWQLQGPEWKSRLSKLELQAVSIDIFEDTYVTGLCQTRAYGEAIFQTNPNLSLESKVLALDYRAHRRRTVLEPATGGPRLRIIQSEQSLTTTEGMGFHDDQMRRLLEDSKRPNVEIYVLPSGTLHPSMDGSYRIMNFSAAIDPELMPPGTNPPDPDAHDVVYHEGPLGGQYDATADQVSRLRDVFSGTVTLVVPYEEWRTQRC